MFGKHRSKGIEPRVNRLHSSSFVAVRDFTTNSLLGVHDLQDGFRGHSLIHFVVHTSWLLLDSCCRMSCLNQLLGWHWCWTTKGQVRETAVSLAPLSSKDWQKKRRREEQEEQRFPSFSFCTESKLFSPSLLLPPLLLRKAATSDGIYDGKGMNESRLPKTCGKQNKTTSDETVLL